jgi:hypothetical protein
MAVQAACRGGSFAVESVAAFAWNGWQASSGISGNLGLEYAVILKKYDKSTMKGLLSSHGQGILLVGAYTPLTSPEDIVEQAGDSIRAEIEGLNSIFRSIFLYRNTESGHSFTELL